LHATRAQRHKEKLNADYADFTDFFSHEKAQKKLTTDLHGFFLATKTERLKEKLDADSFDWFDKLTTGKLRTGYAGYAEFLLPPRTLRAQRLFSHEKTQKTSAFHPSP